MTPDTPPAAPPDPVRALALSWAKRPEIARMLGRAEEDGDSFGVYFAGFTAGGAAEREAAARRVEKLKGGYTASLTDDVLVPDADGPWVLNSDAAAVVRKGDSP